MAASAVGRPVEVHAYPDRIVIRQDGRITAEHPRSFGRGEIVYDPWHYVPVLARKPGALRNGAPFKDWVLPAAMERVRRKLSGAEPSCRHLCRTGIIFANQCQAPQFKFFSGLLEASAGARR